LGKQKKIREGIDDLQRVAVFAHYQGVKRTKGKREGDITIGMLRDGGWMWNIPFLGDTSSVGVVRPTSIVRDPENLKNVIEESLAASRILRSNMKDAHRITSVQVVSNYAHVCSAFHGERWMLLGDAAAFLDPIFSSGVHLSVCSAKFAAEALLGALHSNEHLTMSDHGQKYEQKCRTGIRRFHSLIHLFYESRFIDRMKKALSLANTRKAFTSAIAGDVWNDDNFVFEKGVL
jgi:flavin-dependent dehydrogenase